MMRGQATSTMPSARKHPGIKDPSPLNSKRHFDRQSSLSPGSLSKKSCNFLDARRGTIPACLLFTMWLRTGALTRWSSRKLVISLKGFLTHLKHPTSSRKRYGGAERDRTADPLLAKQVLSQLSYSPNFWVNHQKTAASKRNRFTMQWWARVDLNYRPHAYQACALTN